MCVFLFFDICERKCKGRGGKELTRTKPWFCWWHSLSVSSRCWAEKRGPRASRRCREPRRVECVDWIEPRMVGSWCLPNVEICPLRPRSSRLRNKSADNPDPGTVASQSLTGRKRDARICHSTSEEAPHRPITNLLRTLWPLGPLCTIQTLPWTNKSLRASRSRRPMLLEKPNQFPGRIGRNSDPPAVACAPKARECNHWKESKAKIETRHENWTIFQVSTRQDRYKESLLDLTPLASKYQKGKLLVGREFSMTRLL